MQCFANRDISLCREVVVGVDVEVVVVVVVVIVMVRVVVVVTSGSCRVY